MKEFIAGIFVGFCVLAFVFFAMGGMAQVQEDREQSLAAKIDAAPVGKTIQMRGKGFFVTSKRGIVDDTAFQRGAR